MRTWSVGAWCCGRTRARAVSLAGCASRGGVAGRLAGSWLGGCLVGSTRCAVGYVWRSGVRRRLKWLEAWALVSAGIDSKGELVRIGAGPVHWFDGLLNVVRTWAHWYGKARCGATQPCRCGKRGARTRCLARNAGKGMPVRSGMARTGAASLGADLCGEWCEIVEQLRETANHGSGAGRDGRDHGSGSRQLCG